MNTQQALQVIKQTLDQSLSNGAIKNFEHANAVLQALNVIQQALQKPAIEKGE